MQKLTFVDNLPGDFKGKITNIINSISIRFLINRRTRSHTQLQYYVKLSLVRWKLAEDKYVWPNRRKWGAGGLIEFWLSKFDGLFVDYCPDLMGSRE